MMRIAEFEKVSYEQFYKDCAADAAALGKAAGIDDFYDQADLETFILTAYETAAIPCRATKGSAGYDIVSPFKFTLAPGETIKIPTGLRAKIEDGWVLMIFPRSGLGFKYRLQLDNCVGVIDSDFSNSDNEGHFMLKMTNDSKRGKTIDIKAGDRVAQGIFLPYGITHSDRVIAARNGGIGSTGK